MYRRRGSLLIELGAALAVLASASLLLIQLLGVVASQKRQLQRQLLASQVAANLLEHELSRPFVEIDDRDQIDLAADVARVLGDVDATLAVIPIAGQNNEPAAKRLTISITWSDASAKTDSVKLVGWRYLAEAKSP